MGLGNMGMPMLKNVLKSGYQATAFDISDKALKEAEEAGAEVVTKAGHTAKDVSVDLRHNLCLG